MIDSPKTITQTPPVLRPEPPRELGKSWLQQSAPTAIVLVVIAAIGWWGRHTGWTFPKFADLFGRSTATPDDWCDEHSVPMSICIEHNPSLLPRAKTTWCPQHGVHLCLFEHPELAQAPDPKPLTKEDLDRARRALALKDRTENEKKCKLPERRVQFASEEVIDKMGVQVWPVKRAPIVETVSASGEIQFQQPRVATVSTAVAGRVSHVTDKGQLGETVRRGDILAILDAAEVGKARAELLQSFAHLDLKTKAVENLKPLVPAGAVPQIRLLEAEAAQREAQIRLLGAQQALVNLGLPIDLDAVKTMTPEKLADLVRFLGIPESMTKNLDPRTTSANLYPILAPRDGIVTAAKIVAGEVVDPTKPLFVIADTSRMWLILNVSNEDVNYLRIRSLPPGGGGLGWVGDPQKKTPGQIVLFRPDGSDTDVKGELVWKSTTVDEKTRTVQFRAELPNPDGTLLASTFGTGRVVLREEKDAIVVPSDAVHWEGDCHIVFVRDKNYFASDVHKVFHVRSVRPGARNGATTEILAGLAPGELIVYRNSAALRAELLKNNLGDGCGCGH